VAITDHFGFRIVDHRAGRGGERRRAEEAACRDQKSETRNPFESAFVDSGAKIPTDARLKTRGFE
jgi:hypothetical protein